MNSAKETRESAAVDAIEWIGRGTSDFTPSAFYRVVDDPAIVQSAATEGAAASNFPRTYAEEFAATVRQATRPWPSNVD
jgi:hypothetical protein